MGRPWGGADAALVEGRAREASARGRGPQGCPAPLFVRGPWREQSAFGKCFLDPQSVGVGEVRASVNRRRLHLKAAPSPSPLSTPVLRPSGFYDVCFPGATADRAR